MPLRCLLFLATALMLRPMEPTVIPLWPEGVPSGRPQPAAGGERLESERLTNVQVPALVSYPAPADRATRTAVIVCPGGGYRSLSIVKEGERVAAWLNSLGLHVFLLKYRLAEYGQPAPLQDVLRAVRTVRSRAAEFGVAPDRLGVLGFSAGGHLAATAGTMYGFPEGRTGAPLDAVDARPDFLVLVYPVILLEGPHVHAGSREALLGRNPPPELIARWSPERHVTAATPPAFLVHTGEDTAVPLENSLAFYAALRRAGVRAELHLFEKGPHGIGLRGDLGPTSGWPQRCADWMADHGWLAR